jgi:acyl-CoA synthetase (AMP-forming)/AMP-acid ligase II
MPEQWSEAITIGDLLLRTAARLPDQDALVFPDERLSYRELAERARRIARGLMALGVKRGDPVAYFMNNSPETVASLYGIALAGGVIVPVNTRYRATELPHVLGTSGVKVVLTSDRIDDYVDLLALLNEAMPGLQGSDDPRALSVPEAPELRSIVVFGTKKAPGTIDEETFFAGADTVSEEELDRRRISVRVGSLGLLLFTSGTTSQPRAARLTHESLVRNWINWGNAFQLKDGEACWAPGPMFHLGAIGPMLMVAAKGCALLTDVYYEPDRALKMLAREQPAILFPAYPPISMGILSHPDFPKTDFSKSRVILNVGPPDLLRQIQAQLPNATLIATYALTEAGGAVTLPSLDDPLDVRVTTCGFPLPGTEVRIVDPETNEPLPAGQAGEICVRGVSVCDGYHADPEKNAQAFDDEGWLHTGDRGELDADGRIKYLGRLKEMMKVGGENVAEVEVESHISTHPAVKLVQVVGVPDPRLDEVPAAYIELKPGHTATEEDIIEHCRGKIARFKVPRYVRFVTSEEWPMSASKIQKGVLRERAARECVPAEADA